MKILPILSMVLYIIGLLSDILFVMSKVVLMKYIYGVCFILGSILCMCYVVARFVKSNGLREKVEKSKKHKTGEDTVS